MKLFSLLKILERKPDRKLVLNENVGGERVILEIEPWVILRRR